MTTGIPFYWVWLEDTVFESLVPGLRAMPLPQREPAIRRFCWNRLWNGMNPDEVDRMGGVALANWIVAHAGENGGFGATMRCGALATLYSALCSWARIPARKVCACRLEPDGSLTDDISAEYWDEALGRWVHVLPQCNSRCVDLDGKGLSYHEWTHLARNDASGQTLYSWESDTRGEPRYAPFIPVYQDWRGMLTGVVINGNGTDLASVGHAVRIGISNVLPPGVSHPFPPDVWPSGIEEAYPSMREPARAMNDAPFLSSNSP